MSTRTGTDVDKITLTLVHRQLVNTCDEMAVSMMRTAYSPIFSEGLDFSTLILDRDGNLVANAGLNPSMLGASLYAATWIVREVGAENFAEGDVYIHNDPYRGGSHMPEHMMVMPMFVDGELVAFIGNIAHMAEIGGMAPGSFAATATDVYQEGLRLPPSCSTGAASPSGTSGGSCSPTTGRPTTPGATSTRCTGHSRWAGGAWSN
ncbi:hypothetical protein GCM10018952_33150 [Streptosporangium vulgare]